MPRNKKPAGTAVDSRNGEQVRLTVTAPAAKRVGMPAGLSPASRAVWKAYWSDPVAQVRTPADRGLLLRWIGNVDRYGRLIAAADESPLVARGEYQVAHPLFVAAHRIETELRAAEAQLGIGPLNRSRLGIAVISERRSLADLNARYAESEVGADDGDDPRRATGGPAAG